MANASSIPAHAAAAADPDRIDPRRLVTFLFMVFGMFMAILDIQIVSASLTDIQAGLAASSDEISWVQTSYLIAEVIMIPLSGFLSRMLGTRILFATCAAGFTAASVMCGLSSSINEMILWRAVQGFIGGGMIPTVFAAAFIIFPQSKRGVISAMIGLVATLAPTIGPTVGGYLTDTLSWHWLFFINVLPGIVVTTAALLLIDFDEPDFSLFKTLDWWGLSFMALFLGALQYVLEEGPRDDWFDDNTILTLAWVSGLSAVAFLARVLMAKSPIVDIRAYADRNFALGSLFSFTMGIGLYGLTLLYPLYLAQIHDYSALQIGETVFVSGIAMFAAAPIAGRLSSMMDERLMLGIGFVLFAIGGWWMTYLTADWEFWVLVIPQVFRGVGLMFAIIPINNIALGTLPPDRLKNASGLYNLTRNLGGAVGLAAIYTILGKRADLHIARLHETTTFANQTVVETLDTMTKAFSSYGGDAATMALKQLAGVTLRQATVMAYADVFALLAVIFVVLAGMAAFVKKPKRAAGGH